MSEISCYELRETGVGELGDRPTLNSLVEHRGKSQSTVTRLWV